MKKGIYILLTAASLAIGNSACSDFLEEDIKVGQTAELTYTTSTGIEGLVNACYSFSRGWWGKEAGLGLSEMGTDLFYYGYDNKQKSLNSYTITSASLEDNTSNNACLDHYWDLFYAAVDVCNNALYWIPQCTVINEETQKKYLGEAYFMRALYYLQMVNIWGPIPYQTEPVTEKSTTATRVPEEVVYSNILSDIDAALTNLQAGKATAKRADGHAHYYAALALKARTLLYAASWLGAQSLTTNTNYSGKNLYQLAQTAAEEVISSSGAKFYTNYADTWSMANEEIYDNNEAIWGVHYDADITTTVNCIPYRYKVDAITGEALSYNSLITRTGYTRGGSAMLLMFVSMWNNGANDLGGNGKEVFVRVLGSSTSTMTNTSTKEVVNVAQFYSPYGRGFTRYLPSVYLWKLLEANRGKDQRVEATLLTHYNMAPGLEGSSTNYPLMGGNSKTLAEANNDTFNAGDTAIYYCPLDGASSEGIAMQNWAKNRYRIQFMTGGDIPVYTSMDPATALPTESAVKTSSVYNDDRYNSYKIGGWCSYPGIKKFLDNVYDSSYPTHDISDRDAIVFRLAEMYLIKAEAELGQGNSSDALITINELREQRAITSGANNITGPVTISTILDERAIELCGEQQRWFDLKRTHTLVDRVKAYNAQGKDNIDETHYYRPIPEAEIQGLTNYAATTVSQSNGVLQYTSTSDSFWQNPGY